MPFLNLPPASRRRTIGFLIDWIGGRYHSELWPGIVALARQRDVNLVIFSGGSLYSPRGYEDERNVLYDLVGPDNVDGLVLVSGSLSNYITPAEFMGFCQRFRPLPMVSIAQDVENIPSVLVDNESGMRTVARHLIEAHGYRRIGFVRGPEGHEEAEQRFAAYRAELAAHGIAFDPALVAPGMFIHDSGEQAVGLFLDERELVLDAIMAADDDTALGVIHALQARGLRVPGDMAVTGFDDVAEARFMTPSITTVRQTLFDQAYKAGEMLLDMLDGKDTPKRVYLPTEMVVRQSCGCVPAYVQEAGEKPCAFTDPSMTHAAMLAECRHQMVQVMRDQFGAALEAQYAGWAAQLQAQFQEDIAAAVFAVPAQSAGAAQSAAAAQTAGSAAETPGFLGLLAGLLQQTRESPNFGAWQQVISSLRHGISLYAPDAAAALKAEGILGQARVLAAGAADNLQAFRRLEDQQRSLNVDEAGASLLATLEIEPLKQAIAEALARQGIPHGYIALYDADAPIPLQANMFLAVAESGLVPLEAEAQPFPSQQLLPPGLIPSEQRYTWAVEALYFQREQLGYVIFEAGPGEGSLYSELRRQFSSAIRGALLLQERQQAEADLARAFKELEAFSYSVSHDLRAPLRAILGYLGLLQKDYGDRHSAEEKFYLSQVTTAANDMNAKIDSLLTFSRMSRSELVRTGLDLSRMADIVFQTLQAGDPARQVEVQIQPGMTANGDMTLIGNVLQNLLGNAWKYTSKTAQAKICFCTREQDGKTIYSVKDNGAGFDMKYAGKLFGAFQRMHRPDEFEGQGIGLATVQRIIRRHGGEIWFEAAQNQGATFYFTLG